MRTHTLNTLAIASLALAITAPAALAREVLRIGADLGVALDGDADRCVAVDEKGAVVDGDVLIGLIALVIEFVVSTIVVGTGTTGTCRPLAPLSAARTPSPAPRAIRATSPGPAIPSPAPAPTPRPRMEPRAATGTPARGAIPARAGPARERTPSPLR